MKAFATFGLGPLGSISFQHAVHLSGAARPHGVAENNWIRLDDRLGLVIATRGQDGAVRGYFMLRQGETWHRLVEPGAAEAPSDRPTAGASTA